MHSLPKELPTVQTFSKPGPRPIESHTGDEIRAFDFFRTKVATSLAGLFDSTFWTRHILQAARHEPSVRHAVVALSSLSETKLQTTPSLANSSAPLGTFAIRQHTKAISELSRKIQESSNLSMEVVLMTCTIFICFEMFQNHHESALGQMSSGICVFFNWHSKHRREAELASPRKHSELTIQLRRIFGRMMLQTILFIDTKPHEWQFITPAFIPAMPWIPSVFRSIEEARDCLNNCMCSLYHRELTFALQGLQDHEVHRLPIGPVSQLSSGGPLHQWMLSFNSFVTDQKARLSTNEQKATILLEMQQITASVLASVSIFSRETIFDSFEHSFSQITTLASRLISNQDEIPQDPQSLCPTFDMGILPPLYFVASRCRHPSIRRRALHLLRKGPSQEGIWHSMMLSNIAERIINIEEMDCANARSSVDISATARVSVLNATIHSAERIVALHYCRQQVPELEKPLVLHTSVEY
ncbi:hypothetical protein MMC14_006403 [Varicellaria rhodocarpa]|nr:hypothetical protein [Varicellaria rhodocarpa]